MSESFPTLSQFQLFLSHDDCDLSDLSLVGNCIIICLVLLFFGLLLNNPNYGDCLVPHPPFLFFLPRNHHSICHFSTPSPTHWPCVHCVDMSFPCWETRISYVSGRISFSPVFPCVFKAFVFTIEMVHHEVITDKSRCYINRGTCRSRCYERLKTKTGGSKLLSHTSVMKD
jgi:hypothetical protein